jgi:hypothetical protein
MSGQLHVDSDPATEAALAVIRDEERHPHRRDGERVPDHAPGLIQYLERMVAQRQAETGGAA